MSDLISRKALIKELNSGSRKYTKDISIPKNATIPDIIDITLKAYRESLFEAINDQLTAFDVDEVVEKLSKLQNAICPDSPYGLNNGTCYHECSCEECKVQACIETLKGAIKNE